MGGNILGPVWVSRARRACDRLNGARIVMTDSAREIVERVKAERGESLSLVIGNGCCDSTAPFLFAGYMAGPNELRIGSVADIEVFLDRSLEETFAGTEVIV